MAAQRFKHHPALADLPKGAERALVAQFRSIENDFATVRGTQKNVTPVLTQRAYAAKAGELVLLTPPVGGTLVTIPAASPENITQSIRIAVVGGTLSPGATVSIVGAQGTINGQQTLTLASHRLVELVSCGAPGWFYSV
jgi:hypothetical protein